MYGTNTCFSTLTVDENDTATDKLLPLIFFHILLRVFFNSFLKMSQSYYRPAFGSVFKYSYFLWGVGRTCRPSFLLFLVLLEVS